MIPPCTSAIVAYENLRLIQTVELARKMISQEYYDEAKDDESYGGSGLLQELEVNDRLISDLFNTIQRTERQYGPNLGNHGRKEVPGSSPIIDDDTTKNKMESIG